MKTIDNKKKFKIRKIWLTFVKFTDFCGEKCLRNTAIITTQPT